MFLVYILLFGQLFLEILTGMANRVDTEVFEQSDLGLHCLPLSFFFFFFWCTKF